MEQWIEPIEKSSNPDQSYMPIRKLHLPWI